MGWTKEDMKYLKKNYSKNSDMKEICKRLNRSVRAIQHKGIRLGLSRPRFPSNNPSNKQSRKVIDKRYYEKNKKKVYQRKMARRRKIKQEMVNLLGGKCKSCGYNKCIDALDFHHLGDKEGHVTTLLKNESRQKVLKEAKKCILLCANCHREVH